MSKVTKILCDKTDCHEELEMADSRDSVFDYCWGQVFEHDEHYCPDHWIEYCDENNVCATTGKDI